MSPIRIDLQFVVILQGGLPELLQTLLQPDAPWLLDPRPAILLWRPDTGGWYLFNRRQFQLAAFRFLPEWNRRFPNASPATDWPQAFALLQEIFNIHETTQTPRIPPSSHPDQPAVEIVADRPSAVWIDPVGLSEFNTLEKSAPPPTSPPPSKLTPSRQPPPLPFSPDPDPQAEPISFSKSVEPLPQQSTSPNPPPVPRPQQQQQQQQQQQFPPDRSPHPQQQQQQQQPPPPDTAIREDVIRRFPHLDLSSPDVPGSWVPGSLYHVEVYLDPEPARPGEVSEASEIHAAPTQQSFDLTVWLTTSDHFTVTGPNVQPLTLTRSAPKSSVARFAVLCQRAPSASDPAALTASLSYNGRPCGRVVRSLGVSATSSPTPTLDISLTAKPADLIIEVVRPNDGSSSFEVQVSSHLLPASENSIRGRWPLQHADQWVAKTFENLTQSAPTPTDVYERLRGAGKQLFHGAPDVFKQFFWKIAANPGLRPKLKTVLIMSDDPSVPWELMIPSGGPPNAPKLGALGQEFVVGRWVRGDGRPPTQNIQIHHSVVLAPQYQGKASLKLVNADPEVILVNQTVPGVPLRPVSRQRLRQDLPNITGELVHVVCHGDASDGAQHLTLDDGPIDTQQFQGMEAAEDFFAAHKPFVFLNACEVGRPHPTLTGTGADGFAPVFLQLGASAVIAPLWAIKDSVAHVVATEFYQTLATKRSCQPADLLRLIRNRAYSGPTQGEDTYAAYCFYGDPLTTVRI